MFLCEYVYVLGPDILISPESPITSLKIEIFEEHFYLMYFIANTHKFEKLSVTW